MAGPRRDREPRGMSNPSPALAAASLAALLLLSGCAASPAPTGSGGDSAEVDPGAAPDSGTDTGSDASGERPEGLDASLPVPPGTLESATQEASAWVYIYSGVTSDEARAFAQGLEDSGFEVKISVDSDGVEQWYLQSADWAIKLEETHATESLYYWVDPIIE